MAGLVLEDVVVHVFFVIPIGSVCGGCLMVNCNGKYSINMALFQFDLAH